MKRIYSWLSRFMWFWYDTLLMYEECGADSILGEIMWVLYQLGAKFEVRSIVGRGLPISQRR